MIGITRYSAYVPRFRLDRAHIASAWGKKQPPGAVAVANYDEDAFTLATEAAMGCLQGLSERVDSAYFASTSAPFCEKQMASFLATACDLPRDIFTADFAGSARAGVSALIAAAHAVQAGGARRVLVAAGEVRVAEPETELEGQIGDAAAAVVVGNEDVIAELVDVASVSEEFTYVWRTDRARAVQIASGKFSSTFGYARDIAQAVRILLDRQNLKPSDIDWLALYSPDSRAAADFAKSAGFNPERQLVESLFTDLGCSGCAEPLLLLARALDDAQPGQRILLGSYGEGADIVLLRVTDAIRDRRATPSVRQWIAAKAALPSYAKYLKYRRLVTVEEVTDLVTNVLEYKELEQNVRLYGSRCRECGLVQYPMARVCLQCKAQDHMEDVPLSRHGTVFTFTIDHLIPSVNLPLPMAVVDLDGGGRIYVQVTDTSEVSVGDRVVLTFRRLHEGGGIYNYYWKARPVR